MFKFKKMLVLSLLALCLQGSAYAVHDSYGGDASGYYPGYTEECNDSPQLPILDRSKKRAKKIIISDAPLEKAVAKIEAKIAAEAVVETASADKIIKRSWLDMAKSDQSKAVALPVFNPGFEFFNYTGIGSVKNKVFSFLDKAQASIFVQVDQLRPIFANKLAALKKRNTKLNITVLTNVDAYNCNTCTKQKKQKKCDGCKSAKSFNDAVELLVKNGVSVFFPQMIQPIHDKFIVVDGHLTLIGSCNYTYAGLHLNTESGVTIDDKGVADYYLNYGSFCRHSDGCRKASLAGNQVSIEKSDTDGDAFFEILNKISNNDDSTKQSILGNGMDICFSVNDNISDFICKAIAEARRSIYIQVFNLTSPKILNALYDALMKNDKLVVVIRTGEGAESIEKSIKDLESSLNPVLIVNKKGRSQREQKKMRKNKPAPSHATKIKFKEVSCPLSNDGRAWCVHDKLIVIDSETVITGSANFTEGTDNSEKLENMIQIKDAKLAEEMLNYMSDK